jgi:hypothetical protein
MKEFINTWRTVILLSLTLGLAPFFPEPHIWGKLRWVVGGGKGMAAMDWFDLIFHGLPWILLIRLGLITLFKKVGTRNS